MLLQPVYVIANEATFSFGPGDHAKIQISCNKNVEVLDTELCNCTVYNKIPLKVARKAGKQIRAIGPTFICKLQPHPKIFATKFLLNKEPKL